MDLSSAAYAYQFSNVTGISPDALGIVTVVFLILATLASVIAGPYVYGFSAYRKRESEKAEKKRTIQNLLAMKDIQTELEEEMKRALTNANFTP
ncbi:MAG: hypothetical protein QG650_1133 [Patescibacteria group bacterium]|nr:hypothetical protein [Patescibacteria group bacterium]